jgi:putative PIN family toxin of toxin-antitoxin system
MDKIILDTNIILSALKSKNGASNKLLSLAGLGMYDLMLSNTLVIEYEAVLKRHFPISDVEVLLNYLCSICVEVSLFYLWRPELKDPKDDFILELAVASSSRIITHNIRDFESAKKFGIIVQSPSEYLKEKKWVQ